MHKTVKSSRQTSGSRSRCWRLAALVAALGYAIQSTALADSALSPRSDNRLSPSLERQIDRLGRDGTADPLTRRRLLDQVRQSPQGSDRRAAERTFDGLSRTDPPVSRDVPSGTNTGRSSLPSSIPSGNLF